MATQNLDLHDGRSKTVPTRLENAARAAVEASRVRPLTEGEWEHERARLLEFVAILRHWDRQSEISESRGDNVVTVGEAVTSESGLDQAA